MINVIELNKGEFVSVMPGAELKDVIAEVIEWCKRNNTTATLDFNGCSNRVEHWVDAESLSHEWFHRPSDKWYQEQRITNRDNKINQILE